MKSFFEALRSRRRDNHRFYHQGRISESLYFVSAIRFMIAYTMLFLSSATATLVGWLVSMVARQSGCSFFESLGYDRSNDVTNEHKEQLEVGYNLKRRTVLIAVWAMVIDPTFFGIFQAAAGKSDLVAPMDHAVQHSPNA